MYAELNASTPAARPLRAKNHNAAPPVSMRRSILLVEHDKETREMVYEFLDGMGHSVAVARAGAQAEQLWHTASPDIIVVDCALPDGSSLSLISRFKQLDPFVRIIALSGYGSLDDAVEAMRLGAEQFLTKPVDRSALSRGIDRALDDQRNRRYQQVREFARAASPNLLAGSSDAIREVADAAHFVAGGSGPVLIEGELGTGKRWLAKWLHQHSPRVAEPFVEVDCADQSLLESKLFGYTKGRPNEAMPGEGGRFSLAQHGTMFLNDVDRIDIRLQARLAALLERTDPDRPNSLRRRNLDFRLIVAARESIAQLVKEKRFRSDLYAQLVKNRLAMPSLSERVEDIPLLATEILNNLAGEIGMRTFELTDDALAALETHSWPGNLRQLRNVLEHALLLTGGGVITEMHLHLSSDTQTQMSQPPTHFTLKQLQRYYIEQVFRAERGRVDATAKRLGIPRSSLYHKLKQYRIERFGSTPVHHLDWILDGDERQTFTPGPRKGS